jgi:glycerophosphoryl diester phosphodiesterase
MVKFFAHRGFSENKFQENSIDSLKNAYQKKFRAVEFDIWFIENQLVLKHDQPKKNEVNKLAKFEDYFLFGNEMEYWLDFKNLYEENASLILTKVKETLDHLSINLEKVYFAPFITNYSLAKIIFTKIKEIFGNEVNLVAVCEELETRESKVSLIEFLFNNQIKFLSINHQLINKNLMMILPKVNFLVWTVNEIERVDELVLLGIKNFATDKISDYKTNNNFLVINI